MIKVIAVKNAEELAQKAYEKIVSVMESKNEVTLGLATGGSPLGIYALMRENKPATSHVTTINLDEYIGLEPTHDQSYRYFMNDQLFNHLPFKATYVPDGIAADLQKACGDYEAIIAANPVDLQLLGIGENGHIAFNEPGTSFDSPTQVTGLTESTINANSRYFEKKEDVPTSAITMGIGSIMKAKEILLIASGEKKAEAIKQMLEGNVTEACPATALQHHANVTVIADEAALSLCQDKKEAQAV
ncbi:glucosamine-6-phosphate deaminase [Priestia taiwanensis]|uniref:Glucosamine-6-phosphate deaminase n=1 Tax=Priestia taiwanensis TaxID=1347902 RepID=A0A917AR86_9BACI|nr:glucosamine-6-phosphate deaminase [Priestia taiwanensis]MBM7363870.1 glucosamine-6-phosphate deaminase [Priestia taiwanensis]GGE69668.1 glucosamine-6-phosphate deaminase [Priestia taiwanensis]